MSYVLLLIPFLLGAIGFAVVVLRDTKRRWLALVLGAVAIVALTIVFDSLMIAADFFRYPSEQLLGLRVWLAPIEDLGYALVGVLTVAALWWLRTGELRRLLLASRPVSWINTAFPFAAAMVLAGQIDARLVIGTLFFLVPYNLAMYGINDVFDHDSDAANPRKGGVEGALLPVTMHRATIIAAIAVSAPFVFVLVVLGNPASWAVLTVSLFSVVAYSVPGLRFKEIPVLDSITSSTHFVSPAIYGIVLAGTQWTPELTLILTAFFLWGMASHAFGAVQDIVPDREGGIASVATALGARATVRLAVLFWALAGVLLLFAGWPVALAAALALPYIALAAPFWNVTDALSGTVNRGWRKFLWANYVCGFLVTMLCIAWWMLERGGA